MYFVTLVTFICASLGVAIASPTLAARLSTCPTTVPLVCDIVAGAMVNNIVVPALGVHPPDICDVCGGTCLPSVDANASSAELPPIIADLLGLLGPLGPNVTISGDFSVGFRCDLSPYPSRGH